MRNLTFPLTPSLLLLLMENFFNPLPDPGSRNMKSQSRVS